MHRPIWPAETAGKRSRQIIGSVQPISNMRLASFVPFDWLET
jgi:hypothetical protein